MKNSIKILTMALISMFMLVGTAFAGPISVVDLNVLENNGDYTFLVSLENANVATGVYGEVIFTIEELGTSKNMGPFKVDSNGTVVAAYNLKDVTDSYDLLKKGNTYQVSVEVDGTKVTKPFLFGGVEASEGLDLVLDEISVNGLTVTGTDTLQVLNGEELTISIRMSALANFDNARIMAFIEGYEHSTIVDSTDIFSVVEGKTYVKTFKVTLPEDMNSMQDYKLRIAGANDLSGLTYKDFTLYVDTQRNRVDILDLVLTPSSGVEPGQTIFAEVRMKNRGQRSQDSVKVTVEIEELGVSESTYTTNLNTDEVITSDDMLLFIPEEASAGQYDVKVTLSYNDGYDKSTSVYTLNVIAPKTVEEKNLLVSFKNNIDLKAGEANTFEVVIANPNSESKPISLAVVDNVWADVEVSPSLAMVQAGASETFKVTVTPKSAVSGEKQLTLTVKEGSKAVSNLEVSTYVEAGDSINWLNVGLAVLLIIAIIILLAIVITIARRKNEGNDEEISTTEEYY